MSEVLVGHTLHRDLDALRMDALLIFDISLLRLRLEVIEPIKRQKVSRDSCLRYLKVMVVV